MKDVEYLQKDDKVSFGSTNYKAISEEKVTISVRNAMIKHGVVILPVSVALAKEGSLSSVHCQYKIVNVDDPTDFELISSVGQGADTQDKGSGKAMTYAYKYMMLRSFALPTGEDPDKISSDQISEEQKKAEALAAKKAAEEARKTAEEAGADTGSKNDTNKSGLSAEEAKAKFLEMINAKKFTAKSFVTMFGIPTNADQTIKMFSKDGDKLVIEILLDFNDHVDKQLNGATGGVLAFVKHSKLTAKSIVELMKDKVKLTGQVEEYMDHL